jgi:hypothetical protein
MQKRGLSDVITTVLIILVVMVAMVVVWNFVRIFLQSSSISTSAYTTSISVSEQSIVVDPSARKVTALVGRGAGQGNVIGFMVGLTDTSGNKANARYNGTINELEQKYITVDYSGTNIGTISKVSFTPIFLDASTSKESLGIVAADVAVTKTKPTFPSGLTAQWTFDTDYRDSIGNVQGTPGMLMNIDQTQKKIGSASVLLGGSYPDNVTIPAGPLTNGAAFTYAAWIKTRNAQVDDDITMDIFTKNSNNAASGFYVRHAIGNGAWVYRVGGVTGTTAINNAVIPLDTNSWHFIAITYEANNMSFKYDDRIWSKIPADTYVNSPMPLSIGASYNGSIDQLLIFNRALNATDLEIIRTEYS